MWGSDTMGITETRLQIPAWATSSKSRDLWGSTCLSLKWGAIRVCATAPTTLKITHFAMYNKPFFAQVSGGKRRMHIICEDDEYTPWV